MEAIFEVAQIEFDDVKLVLVFVERAPDASAFAALERAAGSAGLAGELIAIWPDQFRRTRFLARPERHAFLRIADYDQLRAQINASLRCPQF